MARAEAERCANDPRRFRRRMSCNCGNCATGAAPAAGYSSAAVLLRIVQVLANRTGTELAASETKAIGTVELLVRSQLEHLRAEGILDLAQFFIAAFADRRAAEVVPTFARSLFDAVRYFDVHRSLLDHDPDVPGNIRQVLCPGT
jgi:hypothetical protein